MFILTINGRETEGAYSVTNDEGEQILYLFEEEDVDYTPVAEFKYRGIDVYVQTSDMPTYLGKRDPKEVS